MSWSSEVITNYHSFANEFKGTNLTIYIENKSDEFFREYSKVIREIFLYDLYLCNEKTNLKNLFRIDENLNYEDNGKSIIESIKEKFKIKKEELNKKYTINQNELFNLNQKLKNDNLIKNNYLHLYINAHILFDSIKNLLKKFVDVNFKSEMENIKEQFNNNKTIRKNKINELNNKKLCSYTALKLNFKECFYNNYCPSMKKIKDEIKDFLEKNDIL